MRKRKPTRTGTRKDSPVVASLRTAASREILGYDWEKSERTELEEEILILIKCQKGRGRGGLQVNLANRGGIRVA